MDHLRSIFHLLGTALLWPVILGLLMLLAHTCVSVGAFAREWWLRRGGADQLLAPFRIAVADAASDEVRIERLLQDAEARDWDRVTRTRRSVRLGPALGLMGTLIPMAAALQGLAEGDLPRLAGNLVTAFSATVIGLAISIVAYVITSVRERWAHADARARAFLAEAAAR